MNSSSPTATAVFTGKMFLWSTLQVVSVFSIAACVSIIFLREVSFFLQFAPFAAIAALIFSQYKKKKLCDRRHSDLFWIKQRLRMLQKLSGVMIAAGIIIVPLKGGILLLKFLGNESLPQEHGWAIFVGVTMLVSGMMWHQSLKIKLTALKTGHCSPK